MKIKSILSAGLVLAFLTAAFAADITEPIPAGTSVKLEVEQPAEVHLPLTFEWHKGDEIVATEVLSEARKSTYTLSEFDASKTGSYWVKVSNRGGAVISDRVNLVLVVGPVKPTIKVTFATITVPKQSAVSLGVETTGTAPLAFTWFRNGEPIPGETRSSITIARVKPPQAGLYSLRAWWSTGQTERVDVARVRVN